MSPGTALGETVLDLGVLSCCDPRMPKRSAAPGNAAAVATREDPVAVRLKEQRFVEAYLGEACGNGARAVLLAGYETSAANARKIAWQLLRNPRVREELDRRAEEDPLALSRIEIRRFWTACITGREVEGAPAPPEDLTARDRLRASELLARSAGMLIERREITGREGAPVTAAIGSWADLVRIATLGTTEDT
jgi:hypothetical protein